MKPNNIPARSVREYCVDSFTQTPRGDIFPTILFRPIGSTMLEKWLIVAKRNEKPLRIWRTISTVYRQGLNKTQNKQSEMGTCLRLATHSSSSLHWLILSSSNDWSNHSDLKERSSSSSLPSSSKSYAKRKDRVHSDFWTFHQIVFISRLDKPDLEA